MARGMLAGITTGLVVTGLGLGALSLALGPVRPVAPETRHETPPEAAPVSPVPTPEPAAETPQETEATERPLPEAEAEALPPEAEAEEPAAPVAPATPVQDEAAPAGDGSDSAPQSTDLSAPAAPPAPEGPVATGEEPGMPEAGAGDEVSVSLDLPERADAAADVLGTIPEDAPAPATGAPDLPAASMPDAAPETGTAPAPATETAALPEMIVVEGVEPRPASPRLAEPEPVTEPVTQPVTDAPAAAVVTGRLPSIGDEAIPEPASARVPAIIRNAVPFATATDQPLLSILLEDTGGNRETLGDLGKLPFPISVAVDAGAPDAVEAIAFYRGVGAEVVLIVPLPEGATATDVDVTFEAYAQLLDQAVAVLAGEASGFQSLGDGAVQIAVNLAETGHGLVSFPQGLNTGHKVAVKAGLAAGLVFRDLDGEGQEGPVIRRFLDNAAFRARNETGVIVVARTQPKTLQALLEWSLGNRAQSVTLAPISAVLRAQ